MCQTHVHVRVCVCVCVCVSARVCTNSERASFLGFLLSHYIYTELKYSQILFRFFTWDYLLLFLCASDVATCGASDRAIDMRSSIIT